MQVVDGIVIIVSFAMDLYFIDGMESAAMNNAASILVIFLLWRILRVFNGEKEKKSGNEREREREREMPGEM